MIYNIKVSNNKMKNHLNINLTRGVEGGDAACLYGVRGRVVAAWVWSAPMADGLPVASSSSSLCMCQCPVCLHMYSPRARACARHRRQAPLHHERGGGVFFIF